MSSCAAAFSFVNASTSLQDLAYLFCYFMNFSLAEDTAFYDYDPRSD